MDPYIEASGLWEDFHNHLIEKIGERSPMRLRIGTWCGPESDPISSSSSPKA